MLTSAAVDAGFSLSTFATGFQPDAGGIGPLGIAFPTSGGVLVSDMIRGEVRRFPSDTDGQNAALITPGQTYGFNRAFGLAESGGLIYMATRADARVVQLNDNGTFNHAVANVPAALGITTDPVNGHLFVSSGIQGLQILDINPTGGPPSVFKSNVSGDGLVSDGTVLYVAVDGTTVRGYRISDGLEVFNSGSIPGTPVGVALGTGTLAGNIFTNNADGTVWEINRRTGAQTLLATGESRGDFAVADPYNGTLLLTQSDRIVRLTAPPGGGFGVVPEPSSLTLLGIGILGVGGYGWQRRT